MIHRIKKLSELPTSRLHTYWLESEEKVAEIQFDTAYLYEARVGIYLFVVEE